MSTPELRDPQHVSESDQARRLRHGLVSLAILLALIGILLRGLTNFCLRGVRRGR